MEAEGLVLYYQRMKFEAGLFEAFAATRMTAIEDGHFVFSGNGIDGVEEGEEVFLGVNVFFAMGTQEDVFAFFETETLVDVAGLDVGEVLMQDFGHGGAGDIGAFFGQAAVGEVASGMLTVAQVDVGDDVDYAAVGFFGKTFVFAAIAGFHVEDGDVKAFGGDGTQAGVGVAEDEQGVGPDVGHEFVGAVDDVADCGTEVVAHGVHIYFGVGESEVFEEYAVEVVVVVLACVCENDIEIFAAFVDCGRKADNLGTSADDYQQFEFTVACKMYVFVIGFHN